MNFLKVILKTEKNFSISNARFRLQKYQLRCALIIYFRSIIVYFVCTWYCEYHSLTWTHTICRWYISSHPNIELQNELTMNSVKLVPSYQTFCQCKQDQIYGTLAPIIVQRNSVKIKTLMLISKQMLLVIFNKINS